MLKELFISETGFEPADIDVFADPLPETETPAVQDAASNPNSEPEAQEAISDADGGTEADV